MPRPEARHDGLHHPRLALPRGMLDDRAVADSMVKRIVVRP